MTDARPAPWPADPRGARAEDRLPLHGLKVIDITLARAGPTAVRHLADWGADVIRIEQPKAPDGSAAREDIIGRERGSDYQNLHRNKRSVRLNLKDPEGLAVLHDLVRSADVVIENMRPGVKHRLGIAFEDLAKVNPRLVYASIGGFGQEGPYRDRPGVDHIAQAMSGLMSVTGDADGKPMRVGTAVGDLTAGTMAALGVMMALFERERTGRGRWLHTSLLESLMFMMDFQAARWLVDGEVAPRVGNEHPTRIPTDNFPTSDGYVALAATSSRMWPKLCDVLGRPEWLENPAWRTGDGRRADRVAVHAAIAAVTRTRPSAHWVEVMNEIGVTCGPIYTVDQTFADPHVRQLGMAVPAEHPELGPMTLVGSPMNFAGAQRAVRRPTPDGGADGESILRELGYSEERIAALKAGGVC